MLNAIRSNITKVANSPRDARAMVASVLPGGGALMAPDGNKMLSFSSTAAGNMLGAASGGLEGGLLGYLIGAIAHRPRLGAILGVGAGSAAGFVGGGVRGYQMANPTFGERVFGGTL